MANHGSALLRKQKSRILDANLKRRARKLVTDSRVDPQTRSLIRYALEIKDKRLEQIVHRVLSPAKRASTTSAWRVIKLDSD
jgi:hypothetical protein